MSADGRAEESPQQGIQSIEVGAQVLRALEAGRGPMALSEVARNCATHPAKVHRYLVSLVRAGLASHDARTGQYDLGPAARHLGMEALRRTDAESTAAAYTSRLSDQSGHTTNVAVWTEDGPIIVRWDSGTHVLPINVRVGSVLPLLDSAVGLMFLAPLPAAQTAGVLAIQQARQETHSRRRRAREAPDQNEARRDRELAAPDDLRDGGVRRAHIRPRPEPRARDRPRHACPPAGRR